MTARCWHDISFRRFLSEGPRVRRDPRTADPVACLANMAVGSWLGKPVFRRDRILDEVNATSGDVRRLMDLFGLTAKGAQRYTATLNHPSLDSHPGRESTAADPG